LTWDEDIMTASPRERMGGAIHRCSK